MALSGNDKAYLQARSGIARSAAIRSNYVFPLVGHISIGGIDFTRYMRYGSLKVRQALNEEPDTCSFEVMVTDATIAGAVIVGADVLIGLGGPSENVLFGGRILTTQTTRGPAKTPSVRSVLCADYLQVLDSEYLITYNWPAQSTTLTILDLFRRFSSKTAAFVQISLDAVDRNLPSHAAFAVVNERFSTVLRRLVTMFPTGGGFYVDPRKVLHVWQGASEPNLTNPVPLTITLPTLKGFAETVDGSQQRDAVLVEGKRTTAPLGMIVEPIAGIPAGAEVHVESIPVLDASLLDPLVDPGVDREIRVGSQRLLCRNAYGVWVAPAGTPQATETTADVVFDPNPALGPHVMIPVVSLAFLTGRDATGAWVVIDDQYLKLMGWGTTPSPWFQVPRTGFGAMIGPIMQGAAVTNIDSLAWLRSTRRYQIGTAFELLRHQPIDSDVVLTVRSTTGSGVHEHLVQDGRYTRQGATNRGVQELADFSAPLTSIDWETEDLNAKPGRLQAYNFVAPPYPAASGSYMILSSDISWPVWGQPPRIRCHAARTEAAQVIDTWLIDSR